MRRSRAHRRRGAPVGTVLPPSPRATSSGYGSGTTITVTKPTGTLDGDWVFVTLGWIGTATVTPPAGFTSIRKLGPTTDGNRYQETFKHKASSDGASYAFTLDVSKVTSWVAVAVKDADPTNAVDVETGAVNAVATSVSASSVTAVGSNDLLVVFASITQPDSGNSGRIGPFTGMTEQVEVISVGNGPYNEIDLALDTQSLVAAGATGAKTASVTGAGFNNGSLVEVIAVKGATGTGPSYTVPGVPTGVAATPGDAQATITWLAPSDGGSPITGYKVTASPGGSNVTVGAVSSATISGLTNGTTYTFTVHATNAVGSGGESSGSNAVIPTTTPTTGKASYVKFSAIISNRDWAANFPGPWYFTGFKYLIGREPYMIGNRLTANDSFMANDFVKWLQFPGWTRRAWNGDSGPAADTPGWSIPRRYVGIPLAFWGGYTLAQVANGLNDANYTRVAHDLSDNGWGNSWLAFAWEAGGNWTPWWWGGPSDDRSSAYKDAWLRVRNIFKGVNPQFKVGFCDMAECCMSGTQTLKARGGYDVAVQFQPGYPSTATNGAPTTWVWDKVWPGDQYVDYIEIDHYDTASFTNYAPGSGVWSDANGVSIAQQVWDENHYPILEAVKAFAVKHGKPLSVGEWGVGDRTGVNSSHWGGDDPLFIRNFAAWIDAFPTTPGIGYFSYFMQGVEDGEHSPALYTASNPKTPIATLSNSYTEFLASFGA